MSSKNENSLFSSYLDSIGLISNSTSTVKAYRFGLKHFGKFTEQKYQCTVHELIIRIKNGDPDVYKMFNEFVLYLYKLGKKPATIRLKIAGVKGFLRHEGIKTYSEDFKQSVKLPKKLRHREEPLTKEILVRLLRVVPIKIQTAILVAIASGMRVGELVQLQISDIDFESKPTKIRIRAETTKTKETRETFLTNEATKALKDYLTNFFGWHEENSNSFIQDRIIFGRTSQMKKDGDQMKFKSVTVAENVLSHSMLWHVRKIPELNKLNENGRKMIHFHGFRKFFRTEAGNAVGRDYAEALMGHRFYLDTYYNLPDEKKREMYLQAEPFLTISDFVQIEKDLVKMTEKQKQLEEDNLMFKQFIAKHYAPFPESEKTHSIKEETKSKKTQYVVSCPKCNEVLGETVTKEEAKQSQQRHLQVCYRTK